MTNKMTKVEKFNAIKNFMATVENDFDFDVQDFLNHEIELISKKSGKKNEKKSAENESIKALIVDTLRSLGTPTRANELQKANEDLSEYSSQKIVSLLSQLVTENRVEKTVDKKVSYFSVKD